MKTVRLFFLSLITGLLFSISSACVSETLTILGNESKPPKYYLQNGEAKGILIDIMKAIEPRVPQNFDFNLLPWKRAYKTALQGKGGIIGLSMTEERLKLFDYSEAMYVDELVLVVLKGQEFDYQKIEDLAGKVVGAQRGSAYGDEFERAKNQVFKVDEDDNGAQRLRKLLAKRIDVALLGVGKKGVHYLVQQNLDLQKHQRDFVVLKKPFRLDPNYLGFAKEMEMRYFLEEFNQHLKAAKESGEIDKIIEKYRQQGS